MSGPKPKKPRDLKRNPRSEATKSLSEIVIKYSSLVPGKKIWAKNIGDVSLVLSNARTTDPLTTYQRSRSIERSGVNSNLGVRSKSYTCLNTVCDEERDFADSIMANDDRAINMQKKTFTHWVNIQLKPIGIQVFCSILSENVLLLILKFILLFHRENNE